MYIILVKNLSNCVSQTWKLDNPYCHNGKYVGRKKGTSLFFLFWEQTPLNFDHFEWACEGMDRDAFDHSSVFNSN